MTKHVLTPIVERFWSKVDRDASHKCWPWIGGRTTHGYGMLGKGRRTDGVIYAHRFSYQIHKGKIPVGKIVMHECNNFSCVNPDHLRAGTYSENLKQAYDDGLHVGRGSSKGKK